MGAHGDGRGDGLANEDQPGAPVAIGEQAEVADAVEAVRQCVQQEAADELGRTQRHHAHRIAMAIIAPAEGDGVIIEVDEAAVGDGDAVGVAAKIGQHVLRRTEGRLSTRPSEPCRSRR